MGKGEVPGFAELIEQAQKLPVMGADALADLSNPFQVPLPANHRVVDSRAEPSKVPGAVTYEYKTNIRCFNLPTDCVAYEEVIDKILSGDGILRFEDKTWTKEGDFVIAICWLTPKPGAKKKKAMRLVPDGDED
jgi:hypothetical protein